VGNEQERATIVVEQVFQPLDGGKVEMVGRLVEQQQFRIGDQCTRQRNTLFKSAGKRFHRSVGIQVQALQGFFDPTVETPGVGGLQLLRQALEIRVNRLVAFRHCMRHGMIFGQKLLRRADTLRHSLEHAVAGLELWFLRNISQSQPRRAPYLTRIRQAFGGDDLEQTGLAGAIAPDQANALARLDHKRSAVKQRMVAVGKFESVKSQERHGQESGLSSVEGSMNSFGHFQCIGGIAVQADGVCPNLGTFIPKRADRLSKGQRQSLFDSDQRIGNERTVCFT